MKPAPDAGRDLAARREVLHARSARLRDEIKRLEAVDLAVSDDPNAPIHPRAHNSVVRQGKSGGLSNQFVALISQAGLRKKAAHRKTHGEGRGVGVLLLMTHTNGLSGF